MEAEHEPGRQSFRDVDPLATAIVAPKDSAVVLLVEDFGARRMRQHLVSALAEFGKWVRQKVGVDALVSGVPVLAAIIGSEHPDCGYADPHPAFARLVQHDHGYPEASRPHQRCSGRQTQSLEAI